MAKVFILGSGNPVVDAARGGPGVLIEIGKERLLFDCGRDTSTKIVRIGRTLKSVNPVFFTHYFHFDHTCDFLNFALSGWVEGREAAIEVYGPAGISEFVDTLLFKVFKAAYKDSSKPEMTVHSHDLDCLNRAPAAAGSGWRVTSMPVRHGRPPSQYTLAYRIDTDTGKSIAVSGDTAECETLSELIQDVDTFICECNIIEGVPETQIRTHMDPPTVGRVCQKANVKRVVLYHLQPWTKSGWIKHQVGEEFQGEIVVSQDCMEIDI